MLASKNRLKKKVNFARIEIDGNLFQSKSFGLGVYDRSKDFKGETNNSDSHFGFVISTKISKKAVTRNRIRRIISEVVRKNLDNIKKGFDIVFLVKPSVLNETKEQLENEVYDAISKNIFIN